MLKHNRFRAIRFALLLASLSTISAANDRQPNVVFILVDDLGWSDLGYCGSDFYETPHIDRLAEKSLRFRHAYAAAPVCSPTRAAILTGKSPARLDMTIWHEGAIDGGPKDRKLLDASANPNLPREEYTLAESFHDAGYRTAHIGKWHLGTAAYYPETQGFDINIGGTFWGAPATFFYPFSGKWNDRSSEIRYVPGLHDSGESNYLPDRLTDETLKIIAANRDRPFFLNLWFHTVHSPIEAPDSLVKRYQKQTPGKIHNDPTYAAMVHRMDYNIGRVLAAIKQHQLDENTIVVFTSDNGGVDFAQRGIVPTSNAPLRSGKGSLYEGGLRVPLLIRWPGKPSGETNELCTSEDFFPTFRAILGKDQTSKSASEELDGVSLLPIINEPDTTLPNRNLYWHFPHYYPRMTPGSAIRSNDWKLVHYYEDDRRELYNMSADPGENSNLASHNPAKAEELFQQLTQWRQEVGANAPRRRSKKDGIRRLP